jgi:hypothetical protein
MAHEDSNFDRRTFLMRHSVIGAAAVMTGAAWTPEARAQQAAKEAAAPKLGATLSPDLNVVKASKGPVMILADEFYKVGPAPRARTPSGRCASPTTSTSAAPSCRPTSSPRRPA